MPKSQQTKFSSLGLQMARRLRTAVVPLRSVPEVPAALHNGLVNAKRSDGQEGPIEQLLELVETIIGGINILKGRWVLFTSSCRSRSGLYRRLFLRMHELILASDKKGKKGGSPAPAPAKPLFVPEPGQKLTREQHAILRAQRAEAAAAEKRALFGSWTGKTPVSVLHEQCQKMEWDKPQVNVGKKAKGYQGSVIISRDDKKTREKIRFTFCDETKFYPTDQEAKHVSVRGRFIPNIRFGLQWAATYALHRFCSHLSIHRLLPPSHQDYWATLEVVRKALPQEEQQFEYAPDPFAALELRAKLAAEREKAEKDARERQEREQERLSKPWEEYQAVTLSRDMEHMIDDVLRTLDAEPQSESRSALSGAKGESGVGGQAGDKDGMVEGLKKLGFIELHAVEATEYASNLESCIEWLCRHVPEDDLPPTFAPKKEVRMISSVSAANQEAQAREKGCKRLLRTGFSRRVCEEALTLCQGSEPLAMTLLSRKLAGTAVDAASDFSAATSDVAGMEDELLVLESIFGPRFSVSSPPGGSESERVVRIELEQRSNCALEIYLHPNVGYPDRLPGLLLDDTGGQEESGGAGNVTHEFTSYQRLGLLKQISTEAAARLGQPMVFDLVSWLDENLETALETKPTLQSLAVFDIFDRKVASESKPSPAADKEGAKRSKGGKRSHGHGASKRDVEAVQERLAAIEKSTEFQEMLKFRKKLPSFAYREKVVDALESSAVLVLCGETGCGKSTQTGQFILEHEVAKGRGGTCGIICTQPRRISALSLAERVAAERGEDVGASIGYTVRGETKKSSLTRLTFCTTGVLLRMVQGDPELNGITHVIIDEVHERSVDSDFLLVILKDLLKRRTDLKLILMSATINSDTFSAYFAGAPVLNIPGFTHPVTDLYLEDIFTTIKYVPDLRGKKPAKPAATEAEKDASPAEGRELQLTQLGLEPKAVRYLMREGLHEPIDNGFIAAIVRHIHETNDDGGAILIFLQGALEIDRCLQTLQTECSDLKLELYPLHASLSSKQQSAVFRRPKKGFRKVVAATNVAETSITIDDVVFVIDSGRVKEMRYEGSVMALTETLASAASCRQRRGRAGRVRPGFCYKLFSRHLEKTIMPPQTVPEILRVPLEQLCLTLKAMGLNDVVGFLLKAVDPPPVDNIKAAIDDLKSLSALEEASEQLTSLGQHLAAIPADVRVAKMLIFGAIFHCLDPILTISALMSTKSPFVAGGTKREEARAVRKSFAWEKSDWLTDCRAFDAWMEARAGGKAAEMDFCERNFLSSVTLSTIADLRKQYLDILDDLGFLVRGAGGEPKWNENAKDAKLIKAAIVAGLYPRVVTIKHPDTRYVETAFGAMRKEADAHEIRFFEVGNERVHVHPASVNFDATKFEDLFLVYHQKVSTTKVFLRDTTMVSPWPLLMLGGKLTVDHAGRTVDIGDGFARFQAFPRIAVLVNGLRRVLDVELGRKVERPGYDVSASAVGRCLVRLLAGDGK
ncbi:hypothetical protein HDU96_006010 [Phlyctochytrium bullatum]|nr:hypothetical protein HDU96_006010 [Phlyctochytrium bullatum]